ncbi:MAG: AraC family transcriptional regulator, partial [Bacteroidota bacterium]
EQGDCFFIPAYADLKMIRKPDKVSNRFEMVVFVLHNHQEDRQLTTDKRIEPFTKFESMDLVPMFLELNQQFDLGRPINLQRSKEMRALIDASFIHSVGISLDHILNSKSQRFHKFLFEHVSENITLEELAFKFGMSTSSFQRTFKKEIGISPYQWMKDQRLYHARCEMQYKQVPASKIYLDLGYKDLAHFSKAFKKKFGYGPKEHFESASIEFIR